jgi:uncharacterized protein
MQIHQLIGERLYLDYLITNNFNFTYENDEIIVDYHSQLSITEIEDKIEQLQSQWEAENNNETKNQDLIDTYKESILMLEDLKNKLV